MIHSMTGFGEAQATEEGVRYRVEVRSVNNRYFKASIKLPEELQALETEVDKLLRSRLGRGSITFVLRIKDETPAAACDINASVLATYLRKLQAVAAEQGVGQIALAGLLDAPGVCQSPELDPALLESRFELVKRRTEEAIDRLIDMRRAEGEALLRDMEAQCAAVRQGLDEIQRRGPSVVSEYRRKLHSRVQQLLDGGSIELDADAITREVAVFADRCDINEEVSRVLSHLDQFASMCAAPEETGRKLDFLAQEMLREANTIGSKANDAEITRHVVGIKAAIDRIKEQVQNVE